METKNDNTDLDHTDHFLKEISTQLFFNRGSCGILSSIYLPKNNSIIKKIKSGALNSYIISPKDRKDANDIFANGIGWSVLQIENVKYQMSFSEDINNNLMDKVKIYPNVVFCFGNCVVDMYQSMVHGLCSYSPFSGKLSTVKNNLKIEPFISTVPLTITIDSQNITFVGKNNDMEDKTFIFKKPHSDLPAIVGIKNSYYRIVKLK